MESERFHLLKLGIALRATASVFLPGRLAFEVTPKRGLKAHEAAFLALLRTAGRTPRSSRRSRKNPTLH